MKGMKGREATAVLAMCRDAALHTQNYQRVGGDGGLQRHPLDDLAVESGDDVAQYQPPVVVPGGSLHARLLSGPTPARVQHQDALDPQLRLAAPTPRLKILNSLQRGLAHVLCTP